MNIPTYPKKVQGGVVNPPWRWAGTAAPAGATDPFNTAPLGSEYTRVAAGNVARYLKTTDTRTDADWRRSTYWYGGTWAVDGNGRAYNTPLLEEEEHITNGSMETGTPPSSWSVTGSAVLTASTERTGGSGAQSLRVERGTTDYSALQAKTMGVIDEWYRLSWWQQRLTATSVAVFQSASDDTLGGTTETSWTYKQTSTRRSSLTGQVRIYVFGTTGQTGEVDDISYRKIVFPTMLASVGRNSPRLRAGVQIYSRDAREVCGVVSNLDSATNPRNFVYAVLDDGFIRLMKVVDGVYTQLISTTATFVQDAFLEIVWDTSTSCQLWYNGAQVGTTQGVTDVGIVNNTLYGMMSTYSTALFTSMQVAGQSIPFVFPSSANLRGLYAVGDSKTAGDEWVALLVNATSATQFAYEITPRGATAGHTAALMASDIDSRLASLTYTASVVTINLGANDVSALPTETTWKTNMRYIINALRTKWPSCRVYIARAWRRDYDSQCDLLATWIAGIVAEYSTGVYLGMDERIWLKGSDNGNTYTSDGTHYTAGAQQVAANAWFAAIR